MRLLALFLLGIVFTTAYGQDVNETFPPQMVDVEPEFPGGQEAMFKYLSDNITFPQLAKEQEIQGSVFITFTIEADGKVSNVTTSKGVESSLDAEAVRVVSSMPNWKPGEFEGKPVAVQMTLPIRFML